MNPLVILTERCTCARRYSCNLYGVMFHMGDAKTMCRYLNGKISFIIGLCIALFVFSFENMICNAADYNLYRNKEYKFSIQVPGVMSIIQSRGPNVKMTAATPNRGFMMSIIVKNFPDVKKADENMLNALHMINLQEIPADYAKCLDYKIINIPTHKVLAELWLIKHTYPSMTFYQDALMFYLISNNKYFLITYYSEPGKIGKYMSNIDYSIGSFVDETNWY